MQHESQIMQFIVDTFLYGRFDVVLSEDTSFLDEGVVDSTGVLELVSFLERTYGVRLDDADIVPENLDSIRRISAFLERKLAQTQPPVLLGQA